ncbi:hypothetical protein [Fulvivirga ligni]|uniref:hypothetical protein n=1 Tax=Fulvivirga ligni TaxID=2904246 RepID=UPI001F1CD56A|nr:hypothetical protein [Fulvivirga ligni]UII20370.1 hypothetical protein LVD16_21235 [Fulvivirga ligni]
MFNSRKKEEARLLESFGKLKDESFYFDKIDRYFRKNIPSGTLQTIDDKTWNDLDMDEIFMFLDRTQSQIGQQYLYHTLRSIPNSGQLADQREKLIQQLQQHPNLKKNLLYHLSRLYGHDTYFINMLFQHNHMTRPGWFWLVPVLSFLSVASIVGVFFMPPFLLLIVLLLAVNLGIHYWNKKNLYHYSGAIIQFIKLKQVVKEILKNPELKTDNERLRSSVQQVDHISKKFWLFKLESKVQSDAGQVAEFILELIKGFFLLEPLLLFSAIHDIDSKRDAVECLYQFIGELDVALSVLAIRENSENYCLPQFDEGKRINAKEMYHPLVVNCVTNHIDTSGLSILLTGSNMSGKTTFIRTLASIAFWPKPSTCALPKVSLYNGPEYSLPFAYPMIL